MSKNLNARNKSILFVLIGLVFILYILAFIRVSPKQWVNVLKSSGAALKVQKAAEQAAMVTPTQVIQKLTHAK